jgi:hypothetical protein
MKFVTKALVLVALVISGVGIFTLVNSQAHSQPSSQEELPTDPNDVRPPKPARYQDNKSIPPGQLISQERAIGKLTSGAKLVEAKLMLWGEAEKAHFRNEKNNNIDVNRQVWVVRKVYAKGIGFDSARCKANAQVNSIVDAETGDNLGVEIRCPKGNFEAHFNPLTPQEQEMIKQQRLELQRFRQNQWKN